MPSDFSTETKSFEMPSSIPDSSDLSNEAMGRMQGTVEEPFEKVLEDVETEADLEGVLSQENEKAAGIEEFVRGSEESANLIMSHMQGIPEDTEDTVFPTEQEQEQEQEQEAFDYSEISHMREDPRYNELINAAYDKRIQAHQSKWPSPPKTGGPGWDQYKNSPEYTAFNIHEIQREAEEAFKEKYPKDTARYDSSIEEKRREGEDPYYNPDQHRGKTREEFLAEEEERRRDPEGYAKKRARQRGEKLREVADFYAAAGLGDASQKILETKSSPWHEINLSQEEEMQEGAVLESMKDWLEDEDRDYYESDSTPLDPEQKRNVDSYIAGAYVDLSKMHGGKGEGSNPLVEKLNKQETSEDFEEEKEALRLMLRLLVKGASKASVIVLKNIAKETNDPEMRVILGIMADGIQEGGKFADQALGGSKKADLREDLINVINKRPVRRS